MRYPSHHNIYKLIFNFDCGKFVVCHIDPPSYLPTYLVQEQDQKFVKGYGFLSASKNMGKNISKNVSKNLSSKYSQKLLDHDKISPTNALKLHKKERFKK